MRSLKLTILVTVAVMAGATAASAQGMYAGGNLGPNFTHSGEIDNEGVDTSFKVGYAVAGFIGFYLGDFRLEGEISYRANDIDDIGGLPFTGSITTTALMANAFYDFDSGSSFVPYVGGGLGVGFSELEILGLTGEATDLAYQFIVGGAFGMSDTLELTVDYRYFSMGTPDYELFGEEVSQEYANSTVMVGLRTRF